MKIRDKHPQKYIANLSRILSVLLLVLILSSAAFVLSCSRFIHIGSKIYYWDHTHILRNQWKIINGARCRFNSNGSLHEGWFEENGKKSYLISGIPVTGSFKVNGKEYYFDENGIMKTGIVLIDSIYYYYGENGIKKTGWVRLSEGTYYFTENGMKTGWLDHDQSRYYFAPDGKMVTGWVKIKGSIYNFREDGSMRYDEWYEDGSNTYYLSTDGRAASGRTEIEGKIFLFSDNCMLLRNTWTGNCYAGEDGTLQTNRNIDGLWVDHQGEKVFYGTYGTGGCLYMPSIDIQVPAYKTPGGDKGQEITDRENSSAYLTSFNKPVIADHKNQGFENIKTCLPGSTKAFLLTENSVTEYICSDIFTGSNVENDILDPHGVSIDGRQADLCLYTCNENWKHVTIVLFKKI